MCNVKLSIISIKNCLNVESKSFWKILIYLKKVTPEKSTQEFSKPTPEEENDNRSEKFEKKCSILKKDLAKSLWKKLIHKRNSSNFSPPQLRYYSSTTYSNQIKAYC